MSTYIYSESRFNHCLICKFRKTHFTEYPCKGCRKRKNPLVPADVIYINGNKYVLEEKNERKNER